TIAARRVADDFVRRFRAARGERAEPVDATHREQAVCALMAVEEHLRAWQRQIRRRRRQRQRLRLRTEPECKGKRESHAEHGRGFGEPATFALADGPRTPRRGRTNADVYENSGRGADARADLARRREGAPTGHRAYRRANAAALVQRIGRPDMADDSSAALSHS